MRYHNITYTDMCNGTGLRTVLWLSGCNHYCKGCHNPQTWDKDSGSEFNMLAFSNVEDSLREPHCAGLTLSGGDPLFPDNRAGVTELCRYIKHHISGKTIWCYTGYIYEDVKDLPIMKYIDVLVDGEFEEDKKSLEYKWAGSTNQRVIDVQKTRETGKIVLYKESE